MNQPNAASEMADKIKNKETQIGEVLDSPLRELLKHTSAHRLKMLQATVCSILNKLFDIMPEILIGIAIDVVVNREQSFLGRFGITDPMQQIWALGGLTFFIWACESIFEFFHSILWRNLAQTIQHELRVEAYGHMQNLDMAYFENQTTGGLVAILNDDVNQLERFLNVGANSIIQVVTTVIAVGGIFFYISPSLATFSMLPIPFIIGGAFIFQRKAEPLYRDVRSKVGYLSSRLANNISGIATIKSFTSEARELGSLADDSSDYCRSNSKAISLSSSFIPIIRMAVLGGFMGTFLYGGHLVLNGSLNVGSYGVLVFLTQRLLWPLTGMAETVDLYERAMASTRRILLLIRTKVTIESGSDSLNSKDIKGDIQFEQLSFSYPDRELVIKNIQIDIKAGQTIGVVGSTGSGKSTLVKLLLRFYDPKSGRVLLDGKDIRDFSIEDLRRSIGLVSQDVYLFHGTVRENLSYGKPNATQKEIEEVAKIAEAHEFISEMPDGYDTLIGERGQKLSGGQRQRISIARAILKDPPIIVLDEATSAVDNETEAAIQRSLKKIAVGRTTIIIAHRLSTITHADQIFVIDKGSVAEKGTSEQLIKEDGVYANLWQVQVGVTPAEFSRLS